MVASTRVLAATLAGAGLWFGSSCAAAEIINLTVDRDANRYSVSLDVALDTSTGQAFEVMRDYARLGDINPAIQSVAVLGAAPSGGMRVQTAVKVCILFFCRTLEQVQDMQAISDGQTGRISADVIPELSNLSYGRGDWLIQPCDDKPAACLNFAVTVEPDFWIPPLIGPWAIKKKLREEAVQTSLGIESAAKNRQ